MKTGTKTRRLKINQGAAAWSACNEVWNRRHVPHGGEDTPDANAGRVLCDYLHPGYGTWQTTPAEATFYFPASVIARDVPDGAAQDFYLRAVVRLHAIESGDTPDDLL